MVQDLRLWFWHDCKRCVEGTEVGYAEVIYIVCFEVIHTRCVKIIVIICVEMIETRCVEMTEIGVLK